jgi:hypothetical protein
MPPKKNAAIVPPAQLETRIHVIRGQRVMLDFDIAALYGIATIALNQAVKRNLARFPEDFAFQLTPHEFTDLISQTVISNSGHGGRRTPPRAFTEQGVAMLSSVLRSPTAVRVNIEIMRAFIRLRRLLATPGELIAQLQQLTETVKLHDTQIKSIIDVLQKMLAPPPDDKPKRRIGFQDTNSEPPTEDKK